MTKVRIKFLFAIGKNHFEIEADGTMSAKNATLILF